MSYQGWTNYETWNVALWIANDQGSHTHWCERAAEAWEEAEEDAPLTRSDKARHTLADELKDSHAEGFPLNGASTYSDLLGAALSEVNWGEIANGLFEDCEGYEYHEYATEDA